MLIFMSSASQYPFRIPIELPGGECLSDVDRFFRSPILNTPYEAPGCHWQLDETGQPTHTILETRRRDVKDGIMDHITREPEQVKAFRDTWRDGIHSYLTYLRDRLTVARDLLTNSGSIFVQIGAENAHKIRALLEEVFGEDNFVSFVTFVKTTGQTDNLLSSISDYMIWFAKDRKTFKYRQLSKRKNLRGEGGSAYNSLMFADGNSRRLTDKERGLVRRNRG
jgi:hypothetical protein